MKILIELHAGSHRNSTSSRIHILSRTLCRLVKFISLVNYYNNDNYNYIELYIPIKTTSPIDKPTIRPKLLSASIAV